MAKDPADRYQTPGDVARALVPFIKPGAKSGVTEAVSSGPRSATGDTFTPVDTRAGRPQLQPETGPWSGSSGARAGQSAMPAGPAPGTGRKRTWLAVLIGAVLLTAAAGVLVAVVLKVKTKDGTVVLENVPADAEVLVDGAKVTVTWGEGGKSAEISVKPGTRT